MRAETRLDPILDPEARLHFVGVGGSGMSALAQYRALGGGRASGSDRSFDRGEASETRAALEALGIEVRPQDGGGVEGAALVIASTAVEAEVPDLARARALEIPVLHRAMLLARHLDAPRSIAVAGTSGKSTVTALLFEILSATGRDPGLLAGAALHALAGRLPLANAWRGHGPLVAEADESDGSIEHHRPAIGVLLNLHKDHMEPAQALALFEGFRARTREAFVVSDDPAFRHLRAGAALVFGFGEEATFRGSPPVPEGFGSRFAVRGHEVFLPFPGRHNAANALAALAAAEAAGVPLADAAEALAGCRGVRRRFEVLGAPGGVTVVDDFAHNPAKIAAALACAAERAPRVLAFFQPHGFAPTRFLFRELVDAFAGNTRPEDQVFLGEIYYAGGTVRRDVSSADLVRELVARGVQARYLERRAAWLAELPSLARPGDLVLVMGARDPGLDRFAREVLDALARAAPGWVPGAARL